MNIFLMIRIISLFWKHFVKGLEAGRSFCRGVSWLFLSPGADGSGHLKSSPFPKCVYEDSVSFSASGTVNLEGRGSNIRGEQA